MRWILLVILVLVFMPVTYATLSEDIGEAVFNATKKGVGNLVLKETGMTDVQGVANDYRGSTDSLMGVFYWGIVSNPDHMSGGPVKTLWNAIFFLTIMAYAVYAAVIGIMYMIPKYSVAPVPVSGAQRAVAEIRLKNAGYGVVLMFMSYYIYAFLVYTEAVLVAALDIDMSSFILNLIGHGQILAMILIVLLFFIMSLLLIYRYFVVWIGPIPFTIGLAMRYMDMSDDPGIIGTIGARLVGYTVGMIFVQFVVAFYMYLMIFFYTATMGEGWLFQEFLLIGIVFGGILLFFKIIGFLSSDTAQKAARFVVTQGKVR